MFYKYKVTYFDSYKDEEDSEEGLVYAKDYGAAANAVINGYGKDEVIDIYLCEIYSEGESPCISKHEIDYTFKES